MFQALGSWLPTGWAGERVTLRSLLNRLRWDPAAAAEGVVLVLRERQEGRETTVELRFEDVGEILPAGVMSRDEVFLPYHRVVEVRRGWERIWPVPGRSGNGQA